MKVQVISDYDKCFGLVQELKLAAGKYKRCIQVNMERRRNVLGERFEPVVVRRKRRLCGQYTELDGEQYYSDKIQELMTSIQKEERKASWKNFGMAFVVFKDAMDAQKCLQQRWLKVRMQEKLSVE